MGRPLVIYHANCFDGLASAWCARRRLGDMADYLPAQYGQPPPDVTGRETYILDFSYPLAVMEDMVQKATLLVVLDHHKTAMGNLAALLRGHKVTARCGDLTYGWKIEGKNTFARFDMAKSGARLAWEYFFPGEAIHWLAAYAEDRDLWKFALPHSREVSAYLASLPATFEALDEIAAYDPRGSGGLFVDEGTGILRYQRQAVERICANARPMKLDGHDILVANTPLLISEVAGKLAAGKPFGAVYFDTADGKRIWSLRSDENGLDVSEIARKWGGGGHNRAAGFEEADSLVGRLLLT